MTQVSKYPLRKEVEKRLFELFWEVIEKLRTKEQIEKFLKDLLTPTEEIMLAKRVAIALMLLKKYDYRTIRDTLKVSLTTIGKVSLWLKYEGGGYREVLEKIIRQQNWENLFEKLDDGLDKILPPPRGKNWQEFYKNRASQRTKTSII